MKSLFGRRSWMLILGFGLGVAAGVVFSSGMNFDGSEAAKFFGSLFGSIIAVSGAVSLHYLKESEAQNSRRRHLRALLRTTKVFGPATIADLEAGDAVSSTCDTFRDQYLRACRFAEKYEFDDFAISECNSFLIIHSMDLLKAESDEECSREKISNLKLIVENSLSVVTKALNALESADGNLKDLK